MGASSTRGPLQLTPVVLPKRTYILQKCGHTVHTSATPPPTVTQYREHIHRQEARKDAHSEPTQRSGPTQMRVKSIHTRMCVCM